MDFSVREVPDGEMDGRELNFVIGIHPPGYLITDTYGQRFANEVSQAPAARGGTSTRAS
jgi:hypothetical protein